MALTEALRFLITSDSAQARADLGRLGQSTTGALSGFDKLKGALGAGLGVGAGVSAVEGIVGGLQRLGTFAVDQIGAAVGAASKLQQATGGVRAIFGDAAREVEAFGKSAAESVGLSNAAYQQQATNLGALLVNLGKTKDEAASTAQQLVQIGADRAAATGIGTTADAVQALGAALRGERDPAERYGFTLNEAKVANEALRLGLAESRSELTDAAKATATLSLIQQQSANTTNAFARESDTLAGQQQRFTAELENARAELGEALLPAMTDLVEISRDAIPVVSALAGFVVGFGDAAKSAAGPARDLAGVFGDVARSVPGLTAAASAIDGLFGSSDGGATAEFIAQTKEAFESLREGKTAADDYVIALKFMPPAVRAAVNELLGLKSATDAVSGGLSSFDALVKQIGGTGDALFGATRAQDAFNKSLAASDSGGATNSARQYEQALRRIDDATRSVADAQREVEEATIARFLTSLGATSDEITTAQIDERDATRSLADSKLRLIDAQEKLNRLRNGGAAASRLEAQAAFIEAQRDLAGAQGSGDTARIARAKAALIRAQQGLDDTSGAKQAQDLERAQRELEAAQDGVTSAEIRRREVGEDLNDVLNRGKEGSRELEEANRRLEDANRRVEDASYSLRDAQDQLAQGIGRASSATKTASDRFDSGVKSADTWLKLLATNKVTPDEFAAAVGEIASGLGAVAVEAGKTAELDAYIKKIQELAVAYDALNTVPKVLSAPAPKGSLVGQSGTIGASAGTSTTIIEIGGQAIAKVIVDESNRQGGLPIRIRASN